MDDDRGQRLRDREVTITGRLASMSREQAIEMILSVGGHYVEAPTPNTAFVVVGGDGPPLGPDGRPTQTLRYSHDLIAQGQVIHILEELEFLNLVRPAADTESRQRLYTIAQLSRILSEPLARIRAWVRQGLIEPVMVEKRLCYFEFGQVATARRLQQLTQAGISPQRIHKSLAQISDWLGTAASDISQLEVFNRGNGLLVRLDDGRLADPNGQLLHDFSPPTAADTETQLEQPATTAAALPTMQPRRETPEQWFRIGIRAEAAGEFDSAIEAYQRALSLGNPQPEVCFNLGNTFYAMDRNTEAAACFLRATEIDSEYVEAWNNLGNALAEIGKTADAIPAYRRALAVSPNYADAHYNLAETLAMQGDASGARRHWLAYLQQDPNSQWASRVRKRLAELP